MCAIGELLWWDRERGLVTAIAAMDQPSGRFSKFKLTDGKEVTAGPDKPTTLALGRDVSRSRAARFGAWRRCS
ncbi:MAG: hypothetical protein WDO18_00645 [Acidobacteriota bacterium]